MTRHSSGKNHFAGGLGLLAAAACLCLKGLKRIDRRLREKL